MSYFHTFSDHFNTFFCYIEPDKTKPDIDRQSPSKTDVLSRGQFDPIFNLTSSSAGVSVGGSDAELLGFVESSVSCLPGVLGVGGFLGRGSSCVLEEHLLDEVQLFDVFYHVILLSNVHLLRLEMYLL